MKTSKIDTRHLEITVATAPSRKSAKWRNQKMTWGEFVEQLREPIRTKETVHEYRNMTKPQRDEVKDVGGFVGGYLEGGRRKRGSCVARSLITLDADSATDTLLDNLELLTDYEALIYSTHSHRPTEPRYRVIIPLAREVTAEEYIPLALKIAEDLGIEAFDPTTYQDTRLMYWASVSQDAEYFFRHRQGPLLNPDEILLRRYRNWKDASEWPVVGEQYVRKQEKMQGDPLGKPGAIGAFNRVYSITEAIDTFLSEEYRSAGQGRYTYTGGHTAAGLVVYDGDKFAYSNHATDPASGKLVSAFDLVRLHRFGELDDESKEDTPVNKLPSYLAMSDLATKDDKVKLELAQARLEEARDDFSDSDGETATQEEPAEEEDLEWIKKLQLDRSGAPTKSARNLEVIMNHDPKLKGAVAIDDFAKRVVVLKDLPWRKLTRDKPYWRDADDAGLRVYLEKRFNQKGRDAIADALVNVSERNRYHPVRDYLKNVEWDGQPRVETLLVDYLGAEDTPYTRVVTRKFIVAAVARVMRPGVKFDNVLVSVGPQGIGKTMLAERLGGKWFSNSLDTVQGKDAYEALQGSWIIELGEMSATKKADIEAVKHFVSKTEDSFRAAYARVTETHPRQCVFWGTTNEQEFLRDRTGNRRFWPVVCSLTGGEKKPWAMTDEERDQIWAEAYALWKKGEVLALNTKEAALARAEQDNHSETDEIEGIIADYLEVPITEDWYEKSPTDRKYYIASTMSGEDFAERGDIKRDKVSVIEVWVEALGGDLKGMHPAKAAQIRQTLYGLEGWERHQASDKGRLRFGTGYGRQVAFVREGSEHHQKYL